MENILLALNTNATEGAAFEFACYLSKATKAKIVIVLFENIRTAVNHIPKIGCTACAEKESNVSVSTKQHAQIYFEDLRNKCIDKGLTFEQPFSMPIQANELVLESRFADIIMLDGARLFNQGCKSVSLAFIKNILKQAECPLFLIPFTAHDIEEIVFLYDGTMSSAAAIRQFTYLIPQFHNKRVTILQINEEVNHLREDRYKFKQWLKGLYLDLHFEKANEETLKNTYEAMLKKTDRILVSGIDNTDLLEFLKKNSTLAAGKSLMHPVFLDNKD